MPEQIELTDDEIARRGEEIYQRDFRQLVEQAHRGKFLIMDILTGDSEIGVEDADASDKVLARHPNAVLYGVRIGFPVAYRLGGGYRQGATP